MKNREKKVIILDNLSSPIVYQAIIILKEDIHETEDSVPAEAERIVAGYFPPTKKSRPQKNLLFLLGGILVSSALLFTVLLTRFF